MSRPPDASAVPINAPLIGSPRRDDCVTTTKGEGSCTPCCRVAAGLFLGAVFLAAVILLIVLLLIVGGRPPRVSTNCGTVQGSFDSVKSVFSFRGIPYASAPTGPLRWKPPQALENGTCWSGLLVADRAPQPCVQYDPTQGKKLVGSEDCLYLDIFTPDTDPLDPVPVMVYIHGGYLQFGSINLAGYVPDRNTAAQLGFVFVNIQYRLNTFGWFVADALPKEDNHTGNYGLLDQLEALRWIKRNIRNFGGDPGKVTVFGQSSGGTSVFMLLSTPRATGLFHRAWSMSGSARLNATYEDAVKVNNRFVERSPCGSANDTYQCLMTLNTTEVLRLPEPEWKHGTKESMDIPTKGYIPPPLAIIDGDIVTASFRETQLSRRPGLPDVPVIIGSVAQEMDLEPAQKDIDKWTLERLAILIHKRFSNFSTALPNLTLSLYPPMSDYYPAEYMYTTISSDIRVNCPNNDLSHVLAGHMKSPTYVYVATSFPSKPVHPFGIPFAAKFAFHAWDTFAFLNTFSHLSLEANDADRRFGDILRENIMNFVRTGQPKDESWLPYGDNVIALIGKELTANTSYHKEHCDVWKEYGVDEYAWIN